MTAARTFPVELSGVLIKRVAAAPRRGTGSEKGDHGPQDHGLMTGGQPLVIVGAAAVRGDRGRDALDQPSGGAGPQRRARRACGRFPA